MHIDVMFVSQITHYTGNWQKSWPAGVRRNSSGYSAMIAVILVVLDFPDFGILKYG